MNINQLLQLRKTMYFYHTDILLFVQQNIKKRGDVMNKFESYILKC